MERKDSAKETKEKRKIEKKNVCNRGGQGRGQVGGQEETGDICDGKCALVKDVGHFMSETQS